MRKNIEWLKMTITNLDLNEGLSPKESGNELLGAFRNTVLDFIDQLEEPEITEEQAWNKIELENSYQLAPAHTEVYKEAIQNGVKPECFNKPEKPVIPQFVADWTERQKQPDWDYENKEDTSADSIHSSRYSLELNYWKLIDRVMHDYEEEKEKFYYIKLPTKTGFSYLNYDVNESVHFDDFEGTRFTEAEIKAIDKRYWAFAEEVVEDD